MQAWPKWVEKLRQFPSIFASYLNRDGNIITAARKVMLEIPKWNPKGQHIQIISVDAGIMARLAVGAILSGLIVKN